jgi:hypothetical protein
MKLNEAKKLMLRNEINPDLVLENPDWRFIDNEEPARNKKLAQNPESSNVIFNAIDMAGRSINLDEIIIPL